MSNLIQKKCVPCEDQLPLKEEEIKNYMAELKDDWEVLDPPSPGAPASPAKRGESARQVTKIHKLFKFKNFKEAMTFVNKVADLAESEGHHPDITIHYNKVDIIIWTHAIEGLSENDFILAAKIDKII